MKSKFLAHWTVFKGVKGLIDIDVMNIDVRHHVITIAMHSICWDVLLCTHAIHVTSWLFALCKL